MDSFEKKVFLYFHIMPRGSLLERIRCIADKLKVLLSTWQKGNRRKESMCRIDLHDVKLEVKVIFFM